MKKTFVLVALSFLVIAMLLPSCSSSKKTTTSTPVSTSTTAAVATTTTSTGNWWDTYGTPQYGGTMNLSINGDIQTFDPYGNAFVNSIMSAWMERLFEDNITTPPSEFAYTTIFRPAQYVQGGLAQSWEFTNPTTFTIHLRQNVYWQNIAPANGAQFVASDVVADITRMETAKMHATYQEFQQLTSITAPDQFTVVTNWNTSNDELIWETMAIAGTSEMCMENAAAVAQYGNLNDWHDAIGTGPFMLTNFVDGSSATLTKNPNYWGYDERFPQNKLPYVDGVNIYIVPDQATALADIRTGKLDALDGNSLTDAQGLAKSNPSIQQIKVAANFGLTINPRNDLSPYSDIRVREALQNAINLSDIAKNYYQGTVSPDPVGYMANSITGWSFPYEQWPADLQAQYAYNPTQAKQLLTAAGYPNGFNTDITVDTPYDMDLLKIIQSDFSAVGINMSINVVDEATYTSFVDGHHNDALAANSTGGDLCFTTEPMLQVGHFDTTNSTDPANIKDPNFDALTAAAYAATTIAQVQQIIQQESLLVAQQHYVVSLLQPTVFSFAQPWLKGGYVGQYGAVTGNWGPTLLFYYPARFWIDASEK